MHVACVWFRFSPQATACLSRDFNVKNEKLRIYTSKKCTPRMFSPWFQTPHIKCKLNLILNKKKIDVRLHTSEKT
jgi:hypothetical protein